MSEEQTCEDYFILSCRYGDIDDLDECFNYGVNIKYQDEEKNTCFHYAAANKHQNILYKVFNHIKSKWNETEIKEFLNIQNQDGNTCLHWATINNAIDIAKYLIEIGVDANIKNVHEETALQQALKLNLQDLCEYLTEKTELNQDDLEIEEIEEEDDEEQEQEQEMEQGMEQEEQKQRVTQSKDDIQEESKTQN